MSDAVTFSSIVEGFEKRLPELAPSECSELLAFTERALDLEYRDISSVKPDLQPCSGAYRFAWQALDDMRKSRIQMLKKIKALLESKAD